MKSSNSPLNFPFLTNEDNLNRMPNYKDVTFNGAIQSLFRSSRFVPFPSGVDPKTGNATGAMSNIHNDAVYNISIGDLIDYTADSRLKSMRLTAAHFAYLKDVGVFPNNRLMIARRFPSPVSNDLTAVKAAPLATLISWVPNDNDFMDISFGEKWTDAQGSFEDVLNGIGKDVTLSGDNAAGMKALGSKFYSGFDVIPLPGLMEGLQRQVMKKLGIIDDNDPTILPQGNPNLIKEAKQRVVITKGQPGSGLMCKFSVKMKVEYEQKYINGIDNTLSYFDLIANVLSFATSDSQFMYNKVYAQGSTGILGKLINGDITAVISSLTKFVGEFTDALLAQAKEIAKDIKDSINNTSKTKSSSSSKDNTSTGISHLAKETIGAVVGKYKIAILGIIAALTGIPSTPWHITIGNPKRPVFSSGDMLIEEVNLRLGPVLAWNDLPSTISVEFTLTNARALGAQEVFNRFNTGKARSYVRNAPNIVDSSSTSTDDGTLADNTKTSNLDQTVFGKAIISDYWNAQGVNINDDGTSSTPTKVGNKYTYSSETVGPNSRVTARDSSGNVIYTGPWSADQPDKLITIAKRDLNDS